jgi:hypothetical protein
LPPPAPFCSTVDLIIADCLGAAPPPLPFVCPTPFIAAAEAITVSTAEDAAAATTTTGLLDVSCTTIAVTLSPPCVFSDQRRSALVRSERVT